MVSEKDIELVIAEARRLLGDSPQETWPGGWPNEIEAALIDAILGIRARYGQPHNGVRGAIGRYREFVGGGSLDFLDRLAALDPTNLTSVLNAQTGSGRLKTELIVEASGRFVEAGVLHAADLVPAEHRRLYVGVHGLGDTTWRYFTMLLGHQNVKPDTWLLSFVKQALKREVSGAECAALVSSAADEFGIEPRKFDHMIWAAIRRR